MRRLVAEAIGTLCLVFAGCGAIVANQASGGAVTHVGVSLTFGLIVMAMVYAIGETSGAHINPAVTIGFAMAGRLPWREVGGYVVAQVVGAFVGVLLLMVVFREAGTLGATLPAGTAPHGGGAVMRAFVMEAALTFVLMFVILAVTSGSKERGLMAGAAIGGTVALDALFGGPVSGASMNPARSLAPGVMSGNVGTVWIYLVAPVLGAGLAVPAAAILKRPVEKTE